MVIQKYRCAVRTATKCFNFLHNNRKKYTKGYPSRSGNISPCGDFGMMWTIKTPPILKNEGNNNGKHCQQGQKRCQALALLKKNKFVVRLAHIFSSWSRKEEKMKYKIYNIEWEEANSQLPTEIMMNYSEEYLDVEILAETLSENYDVCVVSFEYEEVETYNAEQDIDEEEYTGEAEQYVDEVEYAGEEEQYVDETDYIFVPDDVLEMAMYMEGGTAERTAETLLSLVRSNRLLRMPLERMPKLGLTWHTTPTKARTLNA